MYVFDFTLCLHFRLFLPRLTCTISLRRYFSAILSTCRPINISQILFSTFLAVDNVISISRYILYVRHLSGLLLSATTFAYHLILLHIEDVSMYIDICLLSWDSGHILPNITRWFPLYDRI